MEFKQEGERLQSRSRQLRRFKAVIVTGSSASNFFVFRDIVLGVGGRVRFCRRCNGANSAMWWNGLRVEKRGGAGGSQVGFRVLAGATSGTGKESARVLAKRGDRVILWFRV